MTRRWNEETWRCDGCQILAVVERVHDPLLKPRIPEGWYQIENSLHEEWSFCSECWKRYLKDELPLSERAERDMEYKAMFNRTPLGRSFFVSKP